MAIVETPMAQPIQETKAQRLHKAILSMDNIVGALENLKSRIGMVSDPEKVQEISTDVTLTSVLNCDPDYVMDKCEYIYRQINDISE